MEDIHVLHYGKADEYKPHFDYFSKDGELNQLGVAGQRVATAIIYLADVPAGGATVFPELKMSVLPKKGSVLFFSYANTHTRQLDPRSLHGGAPVLDGEKWIATKWFREFAVHGNTNLQNT
jgi:prolyl 4-hydroxylase